MYGLTQCGLCRRPRIVETNDSVTTCPYCGHSERAGRNFGACRKERVHLYIREPVGGPRRAVQGHGRGRVPSDPGGPEGEKEEDRGIGSGVHPGLPLRACHGPRREDGDPLGGAHRPQRGVHPGGCRGVRAQEGGEDALRHAGPRLRPRDPSGILSGAITSTWGCPRASCPPSGGPHGRCWAASSA